MVQSAMPLRCVNILNKSSTMTAESQLTSPSASTPAEIFRVNVRQEVIRVVLQSIDWGRTARNVMPCLQGSMHMMNIVSCWSLHFAVTLGPAVLVNPMHFVAVKAYHS